MIRKFLVMAAGIGLACFFILPVRQSSGDESAAESDSKASTATSETKASENDSTSKDPAATPAKSVRKLSDEMVALRDGVRRTLEVYEKQPFNTRQNSATEIMHYCLGYGCGTQVLLTASDSKQLNGITCLCWNYPCAGFEMLVPCQKHIAARVGYGCQEHPGEFLAMLAASRVPANYPIRAGRRTGTVADLVEAEKLNCRDGSDMSLLLIGLSYYVEEPEWKNDLGESWSLERMLKDEMSQPAAAGTDAGVNRLMGLSYAVARRAKLGHQMEGHFQRAEKYVSDFQQFALRLQNGDGSWGPSLLAARSNSTEQAVQLRSTGRILEWLAMSLPGKQLEDVQVTKAVQYVAGILSNHRYQGNAPALSTREIAAIGHAIHGLAIYDERVFKPADVEEKPAAAKPQPAAAQRTERASKTR